MTAWAGIEVEIPEEIGRPTVFLGPPKRPAEELRRLVLNRSERHLWVNDEHWRVAGFALPHAARDAGWTVTVSCPYALLHLLRPEDVDGCRVVAFLAAPTIPIAYVRLDFAPYDNVTCAVANGVRAVPNDYTGDVFF